MTDKTPVLLKKSNTLVDEYREKIFNLISEANSILSSDNMIDLLDDISMECSWRVWDKEEEIFDLD